MIAFDDSWSMNERRRLLHVRPVDDASLQNWLAVVLGFRIAATAVAPGSSAPFDYIRHAFFEPPPDGRADPDAPPRDCVVWANRGGGKTQLGAIATLLDLLFKPGIQVRILAGSFEQSSKMYDYLRRLLESDLLADRVDGRVTGRRVTLTNGSRVEVLSQSERSVRGQRVHRLRCDEVELFDDAVWQAAQMVTRSAWCGEVFVHGSIEALSTMHRPWGLMQTLVDDAAAGRRRLFRWNLLDVLERCPTARACESCPLWEDCGGRAKNARGFLRIDDAIAQKGRVGPDAWASEMLCARPSVRDRVYPEFEPALHVRAIEPPVAEGRGRWVGGVDFGYRDPTVLLWAWYDDDEDVLHIIDEHNERERTQAHHIAEASQRPWPRPEWIGADPAGHACSEQTGRSTIGLWRTAGWPMRTRRSEVDAGIEAVRARLLAANGAVRLFIHPRCRTLIKALSEYHFSTSEERDPKPVKDGPDHPADALRYLVINLDLFRPVSGRGY